MLFENHEINIDSLPKVESGEFIKLDSNYLIVRYIGSFIFFLIVGFGIIGAYLLTDISDTPKIFWGMVIFWILWALSSFILTTMGYRIRGYRLRDKDLIHRKGVIFKTVTTIPFNRVQHCEVSQGLIQRMFDLHTLQIFTAGGSNSDLSIPGLKDDTAQRIKEFIINKTDLEIEEEIEEKGPIESTVNVSSFEDQLQKETILPEQENNELDDKKIEL